MSSSNFNPTTSNPTINHSNTDNTSVDIVTQLQSPLLNRDESIPEVDPNYRIFVAYSEENIFPVLNHNNQCVAQADLSTCHQIQGFKVPDNDVLVMIAHEADVAYPRHALYIVQDKNTDIAAIQKIMGLNNEIGQWHTVPFATVEMMLENYKDQIQNCCDKSAAVSYPTGFVLSAATQLAIFKIVYDLTEDIKIAFAVTSIIAFGAMFYMKAAYSNNLFNQKRVEFNPGTQAAQSFFVNSISLSDFSGCVSPDALFSLGTPLAAISISADVGLTIAKMSGNIWAGFSAVAVKTIEDLLTNSIRAAEQQRLITPIMGPVHRLPGLGALYRSTAGQILQKSFVVGTPLLVSGTYAYAAFSLLKNFMDSPALYLKASLGLFGLAASLGTVPLYSIYELGAAERSLARTGNPISEQSYLRFFQNMGKAQSKNASDSLAKKAAYTFFHSAAQGPTIGAGMIELLDAFIPELSLTTKVALLATGFTVSLLFALSKNKRVFEQAPADTISVIEDGQENDIVSATTVSENRRLSP